MLLYEWFMKTFETNTFILLFVLTKISCFPVWAVKQEVTCLDNITEEKEETELESSSSCGAVERVDRGARMWTRATRWSQSPDRRGDGRVNSWIFWYTVVVFGFVLQSDGKLCPQQRQQGHYSSAKSWCDFAKEHFIQGNAHLLELWRDEGTVLLWMCMKCASLSWLLWFTLSLV